MELEIRNLNTKIQSTGKSKKMRLSDNAASMVFQMFTNNIYSDPIGTVVREITSNCFDAHAELAKKIGKPVDAPVLIKLYKEEVSNTWFISFIDSGVGMSPDRIENIYGVYFESTKRGNNYEIGGYGIGGKTPLAYNKDGFFVITKFNGIEYTYNIVAGEEAPEIHLLSQNSTTEPNGTEVKIPLKSEYDRSNFAEAINKQLHYFENVYFEGFEDFYSVQNDYTIYKGKNFLYRQSEGKVYSYYMHVCLGKVAYPIDFDVIGLTSGDHQLPIALQFEIGELRPTASRETLDYKVNEDTGYDPVKIILKKIVAAKEELAGMLAKQHDNVRDLNSYYNAKEDLFKIKLTKDVSIDVNKIIKKSDINFPNFPYNDLLLPSESDMVSKFFEIKRFGKKEGRWDSEFKGGWFNIVDKTYQAYHVKDEFKRKVLKQAYLNMKHTRFYGMTPHNIDFVESLEDYRKLFNLTTVTDDLHVKSLKPIWKDKMPKKKAYKIIKALYKEVCEHVFNNTEDYDEVVVSDDFIASRKRERLSGEILKTSIPISGDFYSRRCNTRITLKDLQNVQGKIFYGNADDKDRLRTGKDLFMTAFGSEHSISINWTNISYNSNGYKNGVLFLMVSKTNEKYLKMLDNAYPIDMFYPIIFHRKMKYISKGKNAAKYINRWEDSYNVQDIYKTKGFEHINKDIYAHVEIVKAEIKELQKFRNYGDLRLHTSLITKYVDVDKLESEEPEYSSQKSFDYLKEVSVKNENRLRWINLPYGGFTPDENNHNELIEILQVVVDA